jgi:hypothetical protein
MRACALAVVLSFGLTLTAAGPVHSLEGRLGPVGAVSESPGTIDSTAAPVAERPESGRTFAEPLSALGPPDAAETRELAAAVRAYRAAADVEAVQPILAFLERHPQSAWKPSLLANLAVLYRHTGYLDRSLAAAEDAWRLAGTSADAAAKRIADTALAIRIEITSALGRTDELAALLDAVQSRPLGGHAAEIVSGARSSRAHGQ